jgi:predicted amidohydrolase
MRIACLQFVPLVGDVVFNISRADAILERAELKELDWIVLPEMAFSGELSTMDKYHLSNQVTLLFYLLAVPCI